jgi:hypothetical protein
MEPIWWGSFNFVEGQTGVWQIGPLRLAVQRLQREWQIAYQQNPHFQEDIQDWKLDLQAPAIDEADYASVTRYLFDRTPETLHVMPVLADRPVITRPVMPFSASAGKTVTFFVSTPLWVSITVNDPPQKLQEIPIQRPSDTWFGPSTLEGELCYASRTYGRINLENVPMRWHRAVTKVFIDNRVNNPLLVERLSLPVPYLSLYATADGSLWTQSVTMVRTRDTGMATLQVRDDLPEEAKDARRVGGPRQTPEKNMIFRAFGSLFRSG